MDLFEEDAGIKEISEVVASELAIAAKVLHVANTAFYSRNRTVSSVQDAVSLLGMKATSAIVLAIETSDTFGVPPWLDVDELHRHSMAVAQAASRIAPRKLAADALLAGMLHDVGQLLIASDFPTRGQQTFELARDTGIDSAQAERDVFGFDHASIAAYLVRLWHLDEAIAVAVEHHHLRSLESRSELDLALFSAEFALLYTEPNKLDKFLSQCEREAVEAARCKAKELAS